MNHETALHLLATFCTMPAQYNRHSVARHLEYARISRNFWQQKELTRLRHETHIDMCRIHRRAAELVAKHGQRCDSNAYPVSL